MNKVLLIVICIITIMILFMCGVYAYNSSSYSDNPSVSDKIFFLINNDRHLFGVPSAQWDDSLSHEASTKSIELIATSKGGYINTPSLPWDRKDTFIIPKSKWSENYYFSPQTIFDRWTNTDRNFRLDSLNRDYNQVGVGVSSDMNNYYVVILWQ